jgi:hypothetical protein
MQYKSGSERYSGNYDYQLHYIPSGVTPQPWAADATNDSTPFYRVINSATSRVHQQVGTIVCHYGKTTGYSCGTIQKKNECINVQGVVGCRWMRVTGANHDNGDSGGPWYSGSSAYGSHSFGVSGQNITYYMPISNIYDQGYVVWLGQ